VGSTGIRAVALTLDDDDGMPVAPADGDGTFTVLRAVPCLEGYAPPTDPNGDGMYEDLNGNGRIDFNDVVLFFHHLEWIGAQDGSGYFDFNHNGRIDFDDVVRLFWGV
jgi:PKD repeat protein